MSKKYPVKRHKHGDWVIWRNLTGGRQFWQATNQRTKQYVNLHRYPEMTLEQVKALVDNPDTVAENAEQRAHFLHGAIKRINELHRAISSK
jgi:hypothetical protein